MINESLEKLREYLKDMFQFNENDLDFGIYKILKLKKKEIEKFIDGDEEDCLKTIVEKEISNITDNEIIREKEELSLFLQNYNCKNLIEDINKNLSKIQRIIALEDDEEKKKRLNSILDKISNKKDISEEVKDKIYNYILSFFELYYSNGDFGYNDRSYSSYKVEYDEEYKGQDILFHWKHRGSLYIKTGNGFNAVRFIATYKGKNYDFEIRLESNNTSEEELAVTSIGRNNNKDSDIKHYKLNRIEDGKIIFNLAPASTPKTEIYKEVFRYLGISENIELYLNSQDGKSIYEDLPDNYNKVENGEVKAISKIKVSGDKIREKIKENFRNNQNELDEELVEFMIILDKNINNFYIGNDSDYFIHPDLMKFLNKEKDKFIKNIIFADMKQLLDINLDNTTIIIAKTFNEVTTKIIEFLHYIEDFQRKLFTMKKKVIVSEYCMTLDNIPEEFYDDILQSERQLKEWDELFNIKVKSKQDLINNPKLVVDTANFINENGNSFKDKLLSHESFTNLDDKVQGLLINSENYQALNLLLEKYRGKVKCIYIDPPYNTGSDGFLYKDNFRHSSWLTMMENRLKLAKEFLKEDGVIFISVDDNEIYNLKELMDEIFGGEQFIATIIRNTNSTKNQANFISVSHDYCLVYGKNIIKLKEVYNDNNKWEVEKNNVNEYVKKINELKKKGLTEEEITEELKQLTKYPRFIDFVNYWYVDEKGVYAKADLGGIKDGNMEPINNPLTGLIDPIPPGGFRYPPVELQRLIEENRIHFHTDGSLPRLKRYLHENLKQRPKSIMSDDQRPDYALLQKLNIKFDNPKQIAFIQRILSIFEENEIYMDFFAGSGTTAHAVLKLNKQYGGSRKYILVEMGEYFDTVIKPRMVKVMLNDPLTNEGYSHIFKYVVLEQYEDILDNLSLSENIEINNINKKYVYNPQIKQIQANIDLSKPFTNKVRYGRLNQESFIDLIETYNYLYGIKVESLKTFNISNKYYKVVKSDNELFIWRDIKLDEDDVDNIVEIVNKYGEINKIFVNYEFNILRLNKDGYLTTNNSLIEVEVIKNIDFNRG